MFSTEFPVVSHGFYQMGYMRYEKQVPFVWIVNVLGFGKLDFFCALGRFMHFNELSV